MQRASQSKKGPNILIIDNDSSENSCKRDTYNENCTDNKQDDDDDDHSIKSEETEDDNSLRIRN